MLAAIQMVSSSHVEDNLSVAQQLIAKAAEQGAQLVQLPEYFCLMGLQDTDKLAIAEPFGDGPLQRFLSQQARKHGVWLVGGSIPLACEQPDRIYNACLVHDPDGRLVARYDKIHLFGFDNGTEFFSEAHTIKEGKPEAQVFDTPWGKVGLSICYDLRFPELYRAMETPDLIVVPSAFTWTTGKAHWEILLRARAIENQCYVLAAAQGGRHESGRRTWGHSVLIDPWGQLVDCLAEGPGLATGVFDRSRLSRVRRSLPALSHRRL